MLLQSHIKAKFRVILLYLLHLRVVHRKEHAIDPKALMSLKPKTMPVKKDFPDIFVSYRYSVFWKIMNANNFKIIKLYVLFHIKIDQDQRSVLLTKVK